MNGAYELLRTLTSPVVAITSKRGDKVNAMIANSAMRASLSPIHPRVSVYIHKFNFSHDLIFETGQFVLHVLHEGQLDVVGALGFSSGRDTDKLAAVPYRVGELGLPVLEDCYGYFECRVVNVMDTGGSTLFLGAVEHAHRGPGHHPMSPAFLRENMSEEMERQYLANLEEAQRYSTEMAARLRTIVWRDLAPDR